MYSKIWNASRICVSSLCRGHANLLCIVPILVYVLPKRALITEDWCFWIVVLEKTLESPLDCKEIQPIHSEGDHWKGWYWSWNFNTLVTWCEELTHWKRPWCWERLRAGGAGDHRGWDGWMASLTQWTWVWVDSGSWWWTGRPGVLLFMGSQRVRHDWVTELNWWVGKIPWRRKWQSSLVFLPGKSLRQRSLVSYNPWDHKWIRLYLVAKQQQYLRILFTC